MYVGGGSTELCSRTNEVKDQDWQIALFEAMTSAPATVEAGRCADAYSCFAGHTIQGRDVEQAYISAELGGPPTYVQLPRELWTPEMFKMRCPVVRLEKALYGHNSGAYWNTYCEKQFRTANLEPLHGNWPSVF